MKKRILVAPLSFHFHYSFYKYTICSLAAIVMVLSSYGTNYYNVTGSINANALASWTTDAGGTPGMAPADFTSGDIFNIRIGTSLTTNGAWTVSGTGCGIIISGTLSIINPLTINGGFTNNGTFNANSQLMTIGTGGNIAGTGAITFFNLLINTDNATDIVTLSKPVITIRGGGGPNNGSLYFQQGIFKIGAGNTINFDNNSSENTIFNSSGTSNFATTGLNGEDGGKIVVLNGSGANFNINGTGLTTFYDLSIGTTVGQGNRTIVQNNPNVLINGTLTILDNQGKWRNNSPVWGPVSILSRNNNNQQYLPGGNDTKEWISMASGTIGVTAGYPNNVIVMNVGTSASNYSGETYGVKLSGTWSINGTLQAGSSTVTGFVDLGPGTNFTCGGITIENGSRLRSSDAAGSFIVKGNFLRTGSTNGVFNASNGNVNFGGTGTSTLPQNVTASDGSATLFNNITVSNGTYVKLNSPATLGTAGALSLTSGIIETSTTNILSVTNTATTAIAGGSSNTFINGPVKWSLAATITNSYIFLVGKNTTYLPFILSPNTTTASAATVEAFDSDCAGAPDNVTVNSISRTEYWSLSVSPAFTSSLSFVSVSRPAAIGLPFNALAKSGAAAGVYSAAGGTVAGNAVNTSSGIGTGSPLYFVIAEAPLSINIVSVTAPTCVPGTMGSITVAGSGGASPYQYQIGTSGFSSNNVFTNLAEGDYLITIKDAANTIVDTIVTVSAIVLTKDTSICTSAPVNLSASGAGVNYKWTANTAAAVAGLSSTTGQNITATPTATTTYTVTADIYDTSGNKLVNGGFETGNTGFTSNYIHHTCGAYYSSTNTNAPSPWPCAGNVPQGPYPVNHNGLYKISGNARDLCVNLADFGPHGGSSMMIIDGTNDATYAAAAGWSQIVNGLTIGTRYKFNYWVRNAFTSIDGSAPVLRVKINGTNLTATTGSPNPYTVNSLSWIQLSYEWVATGTTATIELFDEKLADASNDFALDDFEFIEPCHINKSVTITVGGGAAPIVFVTQPTCTVATGIITVTSPATGVTYSFDNGVTFQAGATSPALNPATYQVIISSGSCISSATPVTINPAPVAPSAPTVTVMQPTCTVSTGTITVTSPTTGVTYSFDNGVTFQAGVASPALNSGSYQVIVNAGGCSSPSASATIDPAPVTPATPTVTVTQPTCTVSTGTITVTSPATGVTYSFDNGVTFQSGATSAALNSATYQVVVKSSGGCTSSATAAIIDQQPIQPTVDAGNPQIIAPGGSVTLNATASQGEYLWTPPTGLSGTSSLNPVASPTETTTYTLTVTGNGGCTASDDVTITVIGECLSIPKIFTPNSDGFYDKWILFSGQCLKQLSVDVYNRWGGLVYHSQNYDNSWDGTRSGKPLPDATYYYVINAFYNDGHKKTVTGNVTIMR